jgi:hypothetical protein
MLMSIPHLLGGIQVYRDSIPPRTLDGFPMQIIILFNRINILVSISYCPSEWKQTEWRIPPLYRRTVSALFLIVTISVQPQERFYSISSQTHLKPIVFRGQCVDVFLFGFSPHTSIAIVEVKTRRTQEFFKMGVGDGGSTIDFGFYVEVHYCFWSSKGVPLKMYYCYLNISNFPDQRGTKVQSLEPLSRLATEDRIGTHIYVNSAGSQCRLS